MMKPYDGVGAYRVRMISRNRILLAVAVPHLAVAAIGLTHPATLTVSSATTGR